MENCIINKKLKIVQGDHYIFNYTKYKKDDTDYVFYLNNRYIGFVNIEGVTEIIE